MFLQFLCNISLSPLGADSTRVSMKSRKIFRISSSQLCLQYSGSVWRPFVRKFHTCSKIMRSRDWGGQVSRCSTAFSSIKVDVEQEHCLVGNVCSGTISEWLFLSKRGRNTGHWCFQTLVPVVFRHPISWISITSAFTTDVFELCRDNFMGLLRGLLISILQCDDNSIIAS